MQLFGSLSAPSTFPKESQIIEASQSLVVRENLKLTIYIQPLANAIKALSPWDIIGVYSI